MFKRFGFGRHRLIAVSLLVVAGSLAAAWTLYPRVASAQAGAMPMRNRVYSTGPFTLQDCEHVRIGLVLPVVPRGKMPAEFVLLDSDGQRSFFQPLHPPNPNKPPNPNNPQGSFFDSFFDITYHSMDSMNPRCGSADNGSPPPPGFEIHSKGTPGGDQPMPFARSEDGILTGLLLPAVRQNGMTASPLATSMQSFDMMGGTMTHSFFDVFFDVF